MQWEAPPPTEVLWTALAFLREEESVFFKNETPGRSAVLYTREYTDRKIGVDRLSN